jgi:hypothetical protein
MLKDHHPAWAATKRILAQRLPSHIFIPWIASTTSVSVGDGAELLVAVRDEHHRWFLESKLQTRIREALLEAGYANLHIRYLNYNGKIPTGFAED